MDTQKTQPTTKLDSNELVTITNKKTNQVKRVPRSELPTYGLPEDYQSQADIYAQGVMSGSGVTIENVPDDYRGGVQAVLNEKKFTPKDSESSQATQAEQDVALFEKNLKEAELRGKIGGNLPSGTGFSPQSADFDSQRSALAYTLATVIAKQEGRGISDTDVKNFEKLLPSRVDNDQEASNKMNNIYTMMGYRTGNNKQSTIGQEKKQQGGSLMDNAGEDLKGIMNGILNVPAETLKKIDGADEAVAGVMQDLTSGDMNKMASAISKIYDPTGMMTGRMFDPVRQEYNEVAGRPLEGGDVAGRIAERAYDKPVTTVMDLLPLVKGIRNPMAKSTPPAGATPPTAPTAPTTAQPSIPQNVIRQVADTTRGAGSKEYIQRTTGKQTAVPQNQVLLDEGILSHPTETGRIQATSKSIKKYGSELESLYQKSDKVFKGDDMGKLLDDGLKDMGYDAKTVNFIKGYIKDQGGFDMSVGDSLITMEKAWKTARRLEEAPPRMMKNPESAKMYQKLSNDAARIIRDELGNKVEGTRGINAKFSALKDYYDNGLGDPKGIGGAGATRQNILSSIASTGVDTAVNPLLNQAYKLVRDRRMKADNPQAFRPAK